MGTSIYSHKLSLDSAKLAAIQSAEKIHESERLIAQTEQFNRDKSNQIVQLENTNHLLNQELAEKNNQLVTLSKRIYDVESVLGLSDETTEPDTLDLEQRVDVAAVDSAVRATMFRLIPNDSPMAYNRISSSYGRRLNPITGKRHTHTGIDLTCNRGEPILAPADGVVETVRPSNKGFGNFLIVRHSLGFMSSYAHLQKFNVKSGQFVSKGETIATCGNSGNSTGPHLHYEVRFLGRSLNPQYLMEWTPENFDTLFEKENSVKWAPLVKLIDNVVRLQVNLTNHPYTDDSVDTAKSDSEDNVQVN
ncbi:M23 family metallopeptidase [Vibrio sp. kj40-1]|uniref:M23 family metallopeptidase n=1 Tax=Vibrio algarum TaxID=3020714 RepID=A0ABT4YTB5_9VIBR|nr:M23 family metallopeptidase [Vibrio sp. KJ40-1]MDB1124804.1 M23 family metallopeptidase [Vibrio sp. KJ40-1]